MTNKDPRLIKAQEQLNKPWNSTSRIVQKSKSYRSVLSEHLIISIVPKSEISPSRQRSTSNDSMITKIFLHVTVTTKICC